MAGTKRTKAELDAQYADQTGGQIGYDDGQDLIASAHPESADGYTRFLAARPTTGLFAGLTYANSVTGQFEVYDGSSWWTFGPLQQETAAEFRHAFYGSGWMAFDVGNTPVAGPSTSNNYVGLSFVPETTANITEFKGDLVSTVPGYGLGTGGDIRGYIETDNAGEPSGTRVGVGEIQMFELIATGGQNYRRFDWFTFSQPVPVVAGTKYWLVFHNEDVDPVNNYISVNHVYKNTGPALDTFSSMHQVGTSGVWTKIDSHDPNCRFRFDNGWEGGAQYRLGGANFAAARKTIDDTNWVRHVWTPPTRSEVVDGFHFAARVDSGAGDLLFTLKLSGGADIITDQVADSVDAAIDLGGGYTSYPWANWAFTAETLTAGTEYEFIVKGQAGSLWTTSGMQRSAGGSNPQPGHNGGYWHEMDPMPGSYAEYTANSGGAWSPMPDDGGVESQDVDLFFYFDRV